MQVTNGGELFCGRPLGNYNLITDTPANDVLYGMDKADLIRGFQGNDKLMGDAGNAGCIEVQATIRLTKPEDSMSATTRLATAL